MVTFVCVHICCHSKQEEIIGRSLLVNNFEDVEHKVVWELEVRQVAVQQPREDLRLRNESAMINMNGGRTSVAVWASLCMVVERSRSRMPMNFSSSSSILLTSAVTSVVGCTDA